MDQCLEANSLAEPRVLMLELLMSVSLFTVWVCVVGSMRPEHLHAAYYMLD